MISLHQTPNTNHHQGINMSNSVVSIITKFRDARTGQGAQPTKEGVDAIVNCIKQFDEEGKFQSQAQVWASICDIPQLLFAVHPHVKTIILENSTNGNYSFLMGARDEPIPENELEFVTALRGLYKPGSPPTVPF
jgi:hypothetical protein